VCSVCLVGSSENDLWLRLRLSSVPMLILRLAEPSPFILSSSVGTPPSDGVLVIIVQNIRRGGRLCHQVVAMGVANTSTRPVSDLLRLGMGRAQSAIATMPQQRLRPSGGYTSEDPGTVATGSGRIVATSEGGGRPSRQSRPERRRLFSTFT
jgi:hypothetical protein